MPVTDTTRGFNSFAGADIRAVFGTAEIGELQAISYAIQREKAPIYVMGRKNPLAFSRGKRGIAGTCVFVMFDKHGMLDAMGALGLPGGSGAIATGTGGNNRGFLSDKREYRPVWDTEDPSAAVSIGDATTDATALADEETGDLTFASAYEIRNAWYVDQIPPFDVTITAANEYGATMSMRIIGVELLNEGYGISVDDMVSEQQMTFIARAISPWRKESTWRLNYDAPGSYVEKPS
tara:strand:- start:17214 stop:17921 length:708 start_codon:yes stop_codon:yes gene_type:complete